MPKNLELSPNGIGFLDLFKGSLGKKFKSSAIEESSLESF